MWVLHIFLIRVTGSRKIGRRPSFLCYSVAIILPLKTLKYKEKLYPLPANTIIFSVVTASSPESSMFPVEPDGIDWAAGTVLKAERITHRS